MTIKIGDVTPKTDDTISKIGDNNIENKRNNITLSIEEREWKFRDELREYEGRYGKEMIEAFYRYWSEPTQDKSKMKWELQETWDVGRRLENWSKRDYSKKNIINFKGGGNTLNSAQNYATNNQKCFTYRETENERRIREEQERISAKYGY
jgi:hypothetical protein